MTNSFFFKFGVYRVLEKSSSFLPAKTVKTELITPVDTSKILSVTVSAHAESFTDGGQDFHGAHGGLYVEPELLQRERALSVEMLQLCHQDEIFLHQSPHGCSQGMIHLTVLKRRLLFCEAGHGIC